MKSFYSHRFSSLPKAQSLEERFAKGMEHKSPEILKIIRKLNFSSKFEQEVQQSDHDSDKTFVLDANNSDKNQNIIQDSAACVALNEDKKK